MRHVAGLLALFIVAMAHASDGAGYVPAHRTKDGHYVPPNVPPSSAGTGTARRGARAGSRGHRAGHSSVQLAPPLLVEAKPILR